jgi:hypothetical protein
MVKCLVTRLPVRVNNDKLPIFPDGKTKYLSVKPPIVNVDIGLDGTFHVESDTNWRIE